MRSGDCAKQKTGWKQRSSVSPSAPFRGLGAHPACNRDRNHEEAGKESNSRFSAELVNFGKYVSRVDDCENRGGINCRTKDRRYDPTVLPCTRAQRVDFFHWSTVVRADSIHRIFIGGTFIWRAALYYLLFVYSAHSMELAGLGGSHEPRSNRQHDCLNAPLRAQRFCVARRVSLW
jgi:hypothetical protein